MGYNRFYLSVIVHCILIFAAAFLFFYFIQIKQQHTTAIGIAIVALLALFRLIYYVNRTNRILGNFLVYLHEHDSSLSYTTRHVHRNFRGLHENLERLMTEFKNNRIDLEVQAKYLEAILDNVSTGILCFDDTGKVQTINRAAGEYLGTGPATHLDELDKIHPGMGSGMKVMRPHEQSILSVKQEGKNRQLTIHKSQIKLRQEKTHIIAINDISHQMEEQEILSWKKLIRVINHEIMNSVTPILTLTMAIRKKLVRGNKLKSLEQITTEGLKDAVQSVSIIEERSRGLITFIERYKKLTGLPPLKLEKFMVGDLFTGIERLYLETLKEEAIHLKCQSDCEFVLEADRQMLEQVLINLVKNSEQALRKTKDPVIELSCYLDPDNHICISVRDNGEGIAQDKLEQVFVPFFTTRKEGTGIGLSLCRQIIRLHNGRMQIESAPEQGTRVIFCLN